MKGDIKLTNIKKVIGVLICMIGFMSISSLVEGKERFQGTFFEDSNIVKTANGYQVCLCVKEYFDAFENKDNRYTTTTEQIQALRKKYALKKEEAVKNLSVAEFFIDRAAAVEKKSTIEVNEYNKKIFYEFSNLKIQKDVASVEVKVSQKWNYQFSPDIESEAEDTYKVSLVLENGIWKILQVERFSNEISLDKKLESFAKNSTFKERKKFLTDMKKSLNTGNTTVSNNGLMKEMLAVNKLASTKSSYNATKAVKYAIKYAKTPNKNYYYFKGQDCTNYTSQCLYAGGIKMHNGKSKTDTCWFYKTANNRSSSWTGAEQFRKYLNRSSSKIKKKKTNWLNVQKGDIIQLTLDGKAYHSLIVTGIVYSSSGRADLLVCCHSSNRKEVSFNREFAGCNYIYHHIIGNK